MATSPTPITKLVGGKLTTTLINLIIGALNTLIGGLAQTGRAVSSGADFQPTATPTAITGTSITMQVSGNNAVALVVGSICAGISAAEAGKILAAALQLDGVSQAAEITVSSNNIANFQSHSQTWVVPVSSGSRTFQLVGRTDGTSAATRVLRSGQCTLSVLLLDLP
jgi:hypothetical protein